MGEEKGGSGQKEMEEELIVKNMRINLENLKK